MMKDKLIEVKFKENSNKAIIEIPKNILSKIHVSEEDPYIYLNYEYDEINIKRGIKDEKKLFKEFYKLIDKYYKYKKLDEKNTKRLFELLRTLGFLEFNDMLKSEKIENLDLLIIKTKNYTVKIHEDYDVDL